MHLGFEVHPHVLIEYELMLTKDVHCGHLHFCAVLHSELLVVLLPTI